MFWIILHFLLVLAVGFRILVRRHRQPESRAAWLAIVMLVPYLGVLAYVLLGETDIGPDRLAKLRQAQDALPRPETARGWDAPANAAGDQGIYEPLFRVGQSISHYAPVGGNRATLMAGSDAAIDHMVADIDAAKSTVHLLFYIWLTDNNGTKVAQAVMRAARRGVTVRAMVADLGSRAMVRSSLWREMEVAGVRLGRALPTNPLLPLLGGRIDLRNHRKIAVIDNIITYCGSQNCADPAFLPKAKFAPWVDVLMRFEGPVVRQNQHLFAGDWMTNGGDDISDLLREPMPPAVSGFTAQAVGTGPTYRNRAMPEMFETLIYAAERTLFITTPYYVPDAPLQAALCAAANRGVDTTIIFPARNDDFAVGATSRSYYLDLLEAGVKVWEFAPGILHAKTLTLDGEVTLIGSANMDRRSFDLNYENNILLHDPATTAALHARQLEFRASSREVTLAEVRGWGMRQRLWNNALAIVGPVL